MKEQPAPARAVDATGEPVTLSEFGGHEIYPMPVFVTLFVRDVRSVAEWYERALGFSVVFQAPAAEGHAPPMVHLRRRKYQDLLILPAHNDGGAGSSLTVTFNADGEIDALADRARTEPALGVSAIEGPRHTAWNTTDLLVTDPAGHRIVFSARRTSPDPELTARMKALFEKARATER